MHRRLLVLLVAAASAVSGCAMADSVVERFGAADDVVTPTVTIGVLAPLSGGQTRLGRSVLDAVEQAVDDSGGVPGWEVEVVAYDLEGDDLADDLAEIKTDDSTVAVVTGFGPDDVRTVVPELDESGLTVLTPADTDPRHLRGADPAVPVRPWPGYVNVAVEPTPEQTAIADHLVRVTGARRVVVVTDGTRESATRGRAVVRGLEQRGVSDVSSIRWSQSLTRSEQRALASVRPGDALVVDAPVPLAAEISRRVPDGVTLALAAAMAEPAELTKKQLSALEGMLVPSPGLDPRRGSDELRAAYAAAGREATLGPLGPAAYDGVRLLVDSFMRCLPDPARSSSPSRSRCLGEVAGAVWPGLTGRIQFDEYGSRPGLLPAVTMLTADQLQPQPQEGE